MGEHVPGGIEIEEFQRMGQSEILIPKTPNTKIAHGVNLSMNREEGNSGEGPSDEEWIGKKSLWMRGW